MFHQLVFGAVVTALVMLIPTSMFFLAEWSQDHDKKPFEAGPY